MVPEAVSTYLDSMKTLRAVQDQIEKYVNLVAGGANMLASWRTVSFSGVTGTFPPEVTAYNKVISGTTWPGAQEMADALTAWHNAMAACRAAWDAIPESDRPGLTPPGK